MSWLEATWGKKQTKVICHMGVSFFEGARVGSVLRETKNLPHNCGSKPIGAHFGVGEFTHFRTYFSGDWDVH